MSTETSEGGIRTGSRHEGITSQSFVSSVYLLINHCRQLSATTVRASEMTGSDQRLSRQLREKSHTSFLDSQTLRIRKISLDNRCVCVCVGGGGDGRVFVYVE